MQSTIMSGSYHSLLIRLFLLIVLPVRLWAGHPEEAVPGVSSGSLGDGLPATLRTGDFLIVPIPTSNPTTGTGLIGIAGFFWGQTEEQKAVQPPSATGIGAMYTDSESWAVGIAQTAYWQEDRWRLVAVAGVADLNLPLLSSDVLGLPLSVDWEVEAAFAYSQLSRKVLENWYLGLQARYVDIDQTFSIELSSADFSLPETVEAASLGLSLFRDTRDSTTYPLDGSHLEFSALHTRDPGDSSDTYESYDLSYRSYHGLTDNLLIAWRAAVCNRHGDAPLWDACKLSLRGFPTTDYMGGSSEMFEAEARWQLSKRWGLVGFAGAGQIHDSLAAIEDSDVIPSYGIGLRFMVNTEQRINLRLDYGRSEDSDAIYFFVGEAF